jgi:hypothetical protein
MAALVLNRFWRKNLLPRKIIENLKETASTNDDWECIGTANKLLWYKLQRVETQGFIDESTEINNDWK